MKRIAITIALLVLAAQTSAQNVTQSVLEAKFVDNFIRVKLQKNRDDKTNANRPNILNYAIDSHNDDDLKPLDGVSFRVDGPVLLLLGDHNPLLEVYSVKKTRTPDPNHEALKALFDEVQTLKGALPTVPPPVGGGGPGETDAERMARVAKPCANLTGDAKTKCIADEEDKDNCALFSSLINDALDKLKETELDPKIFSDAVNDAHGLKGVTAVRDVLETARKAIGDNNAAVRENLKTIRELFGAEPGKDPDRSCSQINSIILINYSELVARAEAVMAQKAQLAREIQKLHKSLDDYAEKDNWRPNSERRDYIAGSINPSAEEQENVAVTLEKQNVSADATTILVAKVKDSSVSGEFPARRDSFFTIERAMGAIYNSLEYPQYGTGPDENGVTVVKKKDDHKPIDAAIMFNFIPRLRSISGAYPMFQIGFSSAKEFPGLLAGVGVRIVGRFPLSLSAGGMITRYKDLDGTLKVGSPVSGTAEINDHLVYKTSPVAWYGGIQVKF